MDNTKRYRPSLPASLIKHAINLAKNENPISNASIQLIGVLAPFLAKIENQAINEAYSVSNKPANSSLTAKLGIPTHNTSLDSNKSKEEYWKECYEKYLIAGVEAMSFIELQAVREYKYLHDLMTPEEMVDFERSPT